MNRRELFRSFIKKNEYSAKTSDFTAKSTTALGLGSGLAPYTGTWSYQQAKHLLNRTMFGPTHQQINQAVQDGLAGTMTKLFAAKAEPAPPLNYNFPTDPACPLGQSWVNAVFNPLITDLDTSRRLSLSSWQMGNMLAEGVSILEKMTLFWHGHFVTETVFDSRVVYNNLKLYRQHALGNFKDLTKKVTIDPCMLRYLNGNKNTKYAPNENYARELMELFTLGKGPLVAPGDYTTFTETDVQEIAKILTGWTDFVNENDQNNKVSAIFLTGSHDTTTKTLSHRFNNAQITNAGNQEYANLIDVLFQHPEAARFIVRKLYRWFVYYIIDDNIEQNIIEPLAQLLLQNNFEIKPVVETLINSEHFFDPEIAGCMIKSPLDYIVGTLKLFKVTLPDSSQYVNQYKVWETLFTFSFALQQTYFFAPNVAGWKAFYQSPSFYRLWINSVTLPLRIRVLEGLTTVGLPINNATYKVDVISLAEISSNPSEADTLIADLAKFLYPKDISTAQKVFLKKVLLPNGLPDYVWPFLWNDYKNNPNDPNKKAAVEQLLRGLLYTMCDFPEFQLS